MRQPAGLQEEFGSIDVYLFDQLLKGRIVPGMRVLDAGCGGGRNLVYLLRQGFHVCGIDQDPRAIDAIRRLAAGASPGTPPERFSVAAIESLPHADHQFDFVICNAVLHFARDEAHFHAMLREMARVLAPGGIFFGRLMSVHGVEPLIQPLGGRRFRLPAGTEVFLVDVDFLLAATREVFRGELLDPLKSTIVHGQRTMTTWVVRKAG